MKNAGVGSGGVAVILITALFSVGVNRCLGTIQVHSIVRRHAIGTKSGLIYLLSTIVSQGGRVSVTFATGPSLP
jgi:hypothetical protein